MIYAFIAKNAVRIGIGVALLLAAWWLVATLTGGKRAKVEATLNRNVAGAALESGKDAVGTVGERAKTESDLERKVSDAQAKIDAAPDAAGADAAGRDGLCHVAPDLCPDKPVQRTRSR